jgi:phage tail-like protein
LFSTRSLRIPEQDDGSDGGLSRHRDVAPPVATQRKLYQVRLPAIYHHNGDSGSGHNGREPFALRFVGALEGVLDPVLALLDSLPAHFDPKVAPQDLLELLADWLGIELDETLPDKRRRELVASAGELWRLRGTRAGFEQALNVAFPGLPLRVEDNGGIVYRADGADLPPPPPSAAPGFVVYCEEPLGEEVLVKIARVIERMKPIHVGYRLRVKTPRPADQ